MEIEVKDMVMLLVLRKHMDRYLISLRDGIIFGVVVMRRVDGMVEEGLGCVCACVWIGR